MKDINDLWTEGGVDPYVQSNVWSIEKHQNVAKYVGG